MATPREKFQALLKKLFQFDNAELDFGIYRIMNHKRAVIEHFIETDLIKGLDEELKRGAHAQEADLARQLAEATVKIRENYGDDALDAEGNLLKGQDLQLGKEYLALKMRAGAARSSPEVEAEIFNHLYAFFSRYYDDGDFMSLRRYSRRDKYAIPYNGEEVHLHWANADQYYIKTGENFTDYSYKHGGWTVQFRLRNADVEQNNVKGAKRFFIPRAADIALDGKARTLSIPFEYRPLNADEEIRYGKGGKENGEEQNGNGKTKAKRKKGQEGILADATAAIQEKAKRNVDALAALLHEKRRDADGNQVTLLDHHLRAYTRSNTTDFFIHKDLKGFLERELDFYLKNEVLNLDELEAGGEARTESWFQTLRAIKAIGRQSIAFVAQIENFQKRLFEKKKFVTEVHYCVTLDRVPEELYPEIAKNKAQIAEWKRLFHIHEIKGDLATLGFTDPVRIDFLKANPSLVLDTKFFPSEIKDKVLASKNIFGGASTLDEALGGLLVHAENLQALRLLAASYRGEAKCIYLDPPYNTEKDKFLYKDGYKHGTWLAMLYDRLTMGSRMMRPDGVVFISIDQNEADHLAILGKSIFGSENQVGVIVWKNARDNNPTRIATEHEYILCFARDTDAVDAEWKNNFADAKELLLTEYERLRALKLKLPKIEEEIRSFIKDNAEVLGEVDRYKFVDDDGVYTGSQSVHNPHPGGYDYEIKHPDTKRPMRKPATGYRFPWETMKRDYIDRDLLIYGPDENRIVQIKVYLKDYQDSLRSVVDLDGRLGAYALNSLFGRGSDIFDNPKPPQLLKRLIAFSGAPKTLLVDYFAGSGTTAQVAVEIARQSKKEVKYLLVEMGHYFETVLKPRLQKVIYSKEWKDGKPLSRQGSNHAFKYLRLESYEDALDNITFETADPQAMLQLEDYVLSYMLDFETKSSETLLNVAKLDTPFDYKLRRHGKDEPLAVDLPETFNYLIGLHVASRRTYENKGVRYLVCRGKAEGRETAIIWRTTRGWKKEDFEADREFVAKQKLTAGAEDVFVNTDSFIEGARSLDPVFKRRMFSDE